ncbi:MAG: hypothetical protein O3A25_20330 [Acidobacteria bacterium]|nr:hypothetical protein [Acidobacteriota bacterium]
MTKQAQSMLRGMTKAEVMAIIDAAFLALEAEGRFERTGEVKNGNSVWRATDLAMARPDAPPVDFGTETARGSEPCNEADDDHEGSRRRTRR